jgi:hypothetical protein
MNTQPIADLMNKQLHLCENQFPKPKTEGIHITEDVHNELQRRIESKEFKQSGGVDHDHEHIIYDLGDGYKVEFFKYFKPTRFEDETNEPIEWDSSDYSIEGGEVFKDNQITDGFFDLSDFL